MAKITLKGHEIETTGTLPEIHSAAPDFTLVKTDLSELTLKEFLGKTVVLNIFPSIDTDVCAASVRKFNKESSEREDTVVICISADLPFALNRFCAAEGLNNVIPVSVFRAPEFGKNYGVTLQTGPLAGLLSRAVVIIDKEGKVIYTEQVPEITEEPDYAKALKVLA